LTLERSAEAGNDLVCGRFLGAQREVESAAAASNEGRRPCRARGKTSSGIPKPVKSLECNVHLEQRTDTERDQAKEKPDAGNPLTPAISVVVVSMTFVIGQAVKHGYEKAREISRQKQAQHGETKN
jgi:hypothetical protein